MSEFKVGSIVFGNQRVVSIDEDRKGFSIQTVDIDPDKRLPQPDLIVKRPLEDDATLYHENADLKLKLATAYRLEIALKDEIVGLTRKFEFEREKVIRMCETMEAKDE